MRIANDRQRWRLATYEDINTYSFNYRCGLNDDWVNGAYCQCDSTKFLSGGKCEYNSCNILQCSNQGRCLGLIDNWKPNLNELIPDLVSDNPKYYYMDSINSIRNRYEFETCECNIGYGPEYEDKNSILNTQMCNQPVACKKSRTDNQQYLGFDSSNGLFTSSSLSFNCYCNIKYAGPSCSQDCNTYLCNGRSINGECIKIIRKTSNGQIYNWNQCQCQNGWGPSLTGWTGLDLAFPIYYDLLNKRPVQLCYRRENLLGQECNGHGIWQPQFDPNGKCICDSNSIYDQKSQMCIQTCPTWLPENTYNFQNINPLDKPNGLICGGPARGNCIQRQDGSLDQICQCKQGFRGNACQESICPIANGGMCSGNGYCDINSKQCICYSDPIKGTYYGYACEYFMSSESQCNNIGQARFSRPNAKNTYLFDKNIDIIEPVIIQSGYI